MMGSNQVDGLIRATAVRDRIDNNTVVVFDGCSIMCMSEIDFVFHHVEKSKDEDEGDRWIHL